MAGSASQLERALSSISSLGSTTMGLSLPKGFQTSEFYEEKGFIDKIVDRRDMKNTLALLLKLHKEAVV